jgi:ATP-dependent Lon protease
MSGRKNCKKIKHDDDSSDEEVILCSDSDTDSDYNSDDADNEQDEHDDEEYDDEEDDDDESGDDDDDVLDDESDFATRSEIKTDIREVVLDIMKEHFPSKYAEDRSKNIKKSKKNIKKHKKRQESDDDDDEEYNNKKKTNKKHKKKQEADDDEEEEELNNALTILINGGEMPFEEEYDSEDDKLDCDSDDEKTFMKEDYKDIIISENAKKKTNKKKKNKSPKSDIEERPNNIKDEYSKLVDRREKMNNMLKEDPKDKTLIKSVKDYDTQIKKLVKDTRVSNAKKYHKLISSQNQPENEVDFFKKKLSHKEQLKVMSDLKEINKHINIDKPYRLTLLESNIPPQYKACALQKLNVLKTMEPGDPEYYKLKHWVDAFMKIPFGKNKSLDINIDKGITATNDFMIKSRNSLDKCTHGLDDAKTQIMQMLGQWLANPSAAGSAIAIKGPMGTGKTTLVKEGISQILGREFAFIALGGNSDGSFLEGHSYTYEGSSWGKIVQILMECKSMNPVIYFDELDKVSDTPRGEEIIGILTHLTDISQNTEFHDKYFSELAFDLSKCLFIFSYNDESKVNPILKDRMYRVETKGYSTKEKMVIAKDYLLPKIRKQVNFKDDELIISDQAIEYLITTPSLTMKEDGVRNLKRCLEVIHTKLNLFRLVTSDNKSKIMDINIDVQFPFTVTKEHIDCIIKKNDSINPSLFNLYI